MSERGTDGTCVGHLWLDARSLDMARIIVARNDADLVRALVAIAFDPAREGLFSVGKLATSGGRTNMKKWYEAGMLVAAAVVVAWGAASYTGDGRFSRKLNSAVDVLPDAAHLGAGKSGKLIRLAFLETLDGENAKRAQDHLARLVEGRKVKCYLGRAPEAETAETARPIARCQVGCKWLKCSLSYRAVEAGYGRVAMFPTHGEATSGNQPVATLVAAETSARKARKGIWGAPDARDG